MFRRFRERRIETEADVREQALIVKDDMNVLVHNLKKLENALLYGDVELHPTTRQNVERVSIEIELMQDDVERIYNQIAGELI